MGLLAPPSNLKQQLKTAFVCCPICGCWSTIRGHKTHWCLLHEKEHGKLSEKQKS